MQGKRGRKRKRGKNRSSIRLVRVGVHKSEMKNHSMGSEDGNTPE